MTSVDIIIVNWNSGDLLRRCLDSIVRHGEGRVSKVIVIDNGSVDGSADLPAMQLPLVVKKVGSNLGFGRACNVGETLVEAPYILLLNPDAELLPGSIERSLSFMDQAENETVGVLGAKLVDQHGVAHRHCARFPTWRTFVGNSLGLTRLAKKWFKPMLMVDFDHLSDMKVDHVMGAFYLIRTDLFRQLGGFDERFFVYLEDLDLSKRVKGTDRQIQYLSSVEAYHKQGGTSEQVKAHRLFYSLQSNLAYSFKHLKRPHAYIILFITYLIEPVSRSLRALFRRSLEELWFTWRGFGMLFRATPGIARTLNDIRREDDAPPSHKHGN